MVSLPVRSMALLLSDSDLTVLDWIVLADSMGLSYVRIDLSPTMGLLVVLALVGLLGVEVAPNSVHLS